MKLPQAELDKLRRVAEAAHQEGSRWLYEPGFDGNGALIGPRIIAEGCSSNHNEFSRHEDAAHIAAFNPATALALLDHIAAQDRVLKVARDALDCALDFSECGCPGESTCECWRSTANEALAALQAEMEGRKE